MDTNMLIELIVINSNYPWDLLLLADPSKKAIEKYLYESDCYVARCNEITIGSAVIKTKGSTVFELMNMNIAVFQHIKIEGVFNIKKVSMQIIDTFFIQAYRLQ
ncbi:hypothetical protein RYH73_13750 [Olivibacter sp. CPCC 100613]|uniref:hypothetical protein n=1 Tax=Olivibacter sp. CPCC 100613 TaxID=3079931 RepID=UPI002FF5B2C7